MSASGELDAKKRITRLRQRADRHRRLAQVLTIEQDARLAMAEASEAEAEANRMESEMSGMLLGTSIPAPFHEQIFR